MPTPEVLASRTALRLFWTKIRSGTRTRKLLALLHEVLTAEDQDDAEYYIEIYGPMKATNRLAPMLLSKTEWSWFQRLLQALERSDVQKFRALGRNMKETYTFYYRQYVPEPWALIPEGQEYMFPPRYEEIG